MRRMAGVVMMSLVALAFASCATVPEGAVLVKDEKHLPSIEAEMSPLLSTLYVGMTLSEFYARGPLAYPIASNGDVTAYEVVSTTEYVTKHDMQVQNFVQGWGSPEVRTRTGYVWFYFRNDRLVRWGAPRDWPAR